jgi:hypothetical protein
MATMQFRLIALLLICTPLGVLSSSALAADKDAVQFNRDIRPILADKCFACHGPDKGARKAKLRLDIRDEALKPREFGAAIVPKNAAKSSMIGRVLTHDPEEIMPPPKSNKKLDANEKALLKKWITQGAVYEAHWTYIKPTRFPVPKVSQAAWSKNPIDGFIYANLKAEGLAPSKEADRRTLIRRLSFDLTGLPPTAKEVEAFIADKDPKAYGKLVERLLGSPHYGERMAMHWLDMVRYADTVGFHGDQNLSVSPYRDYVINVFNKNMPFDQFTRQQLAGDLLPNPTERDRIASGYNRLGMMSAEGGVQPKEYLAKYIAERVRNASAIWMGATMGCAECHNHKFDPYTQKDFYSFAAFFADITERGIYSGAHKSGKWGTTINVTSASDRTEAARLSAKIEELKKKLSSPHPKLATEQVTWEKSQAKASSWQTLKPTKMTAGKGRSFKIESDGSISVSKAGPDKDSYELAVTVTGPATAIRLELIQDKKLPNKGPGLSPNGNIVLTGFEVASMAKDLPLPLKLANPSATFNQNGFHINTLLKSKPKGNKGWAVMKGKTGTSAVGVFEFASPLPAGTHKLIVRMHHHYGSHHMLGRFRLSTTGAAKPVKAGGGGLPGHIATILKSPPSKRNAGQKKQLADYFRSIAPSLASLRKEIDETTKKRDALSKGGTITLVTVATKPREMRVLPRGNWMDMSGQVVTPAVPAFLPQIKKTDRATRLDLANWLMSPDNPMASRAFSNRLWKMFYGQPISRIMDDLGGQGEMPVHPQLLDWLATEFRQSKWDIKHMVRLMVTSATYRQSSLQTAALREKDPYNRLLARQSRFRLEAEMIRDNALAISGLLNRRIGGKSVNPYQPPGYYAHLNFPRRSYPQSKGDDLWRRGLYTHWQRQFLHPMLKAFDAPSREECAIDRPRSNTPLAALVLLNDPTFVEAARALAARIIKEGGTTPTARVKWLVNHALGRPSTSAEEAVLVGLYQQEQVAYKAKPDEAKKLIAIGQSPQTQGVDPAELAGWTVVSRAILNMHETITRN